MEAIRISNQIRSNDRCHSFYIFLNVLELQFCSLGVLLHLTVFDLLILPGELSRRLYCQRAVYLVFKIKKWFN